MAFLDNRKLSEEYSKPGLLWGSKPNRFVTEALTQIRSGEALDIGIGEGRNALYLAREGFAVEGVDVSQQALDKCRDIAEQEKLHIQTTLSKIEDYKYRKDFDLIISIGTLHLVDTKKVSAVIQQAKEHTKMGGVHVLSVFTKKDIGATEHPELYFFDEGELRDIYKDWEVIRSESYTIQESHGTPHTHHMSAIIAKRNK